MAESVLEATSTEKVETTPTVTPTWRDSLPDDLKGDKTLVETPDVETLARRFLDTKKKFGERQTGVNPPSSASTPEEVKAWRTALGVPEKPEGYTPKPHAMMAHPEWNKEAQGAFLKLAHELHLPPASVDRILGFYGDFIAAGLKSNDDMANEARGELRNDWGVNYDAYLGAANNGMSRIAKSLGVQPGDLFEATKGSDPALVARMFHWVESQFMEHGWIPSEQVVGVTPEMAVSRISELQQQLAKVPEGSEQARAIIDQIANVGRALRAA